MGNLIMLFTFSVLLLNLVSFQIVVCSTKSVGNKGLKKLSRSEVQIKTYLFPCSVDKDILNSTFGPSRPHLHNCRKKFVIRMTVNSGGECSSKTDGFISINHVTDGMTGRKKRLLNPLMVRLKRQKMYQLYDLQLVKSVNAEAKEQVINYENTPNYTGCDTSSSHPTCGFSFLNNKNIPFSEGFCCSCDQYKNDQRQPCESHSHGNKDIADVEYTVHHQRRNRTGRDLEASQRKLDTQRSGFGTSEEVSGENMDATKNGSQIFKIFRMPEKTDDHADIAIDSEKTHHRTTFTGQNAVSVDTFEAFKPILTSDLSNSVTVKSFEFEHSLDKDSKYSSMTPVNIVIDTKLGEVENLGKHPEPLEVNNRKISNSSTLPETIKLEDSAFDYLTQEEGNIDKHSGNSNLMMDRETFKQLMMKNIKQNKNCPENVMNQDSSLNETKPLIRKPPRDVKTYSNGRYDFVKTGKNGFSLKLENNNSELRLQIVTKRPTKGNGSLEHEFKKPLNHSVNSLPLNETTKDACFDTDQTTTSKVKQHLFKNSVLKYFKSHKNKKTSTTSLPNLAETSCNAALITPKSKNVKNKAEHAKLSTNTCFIPLTTNNSDSLFSPLNNITYLNSMDLKKYNSTTNAMDIESLMYKLVPVINTAHNLKTAGSESCKIGGGTLADTDNATYNVYIELKKKFDETDAKVVKDRRNYTKPSALVPGNERNTLPLQGQSIPDHDISSDKYNLNNVENQVDDKPLHISRSQSAKDKQSSNNLLNCLFHENIQKRDTSCDIQIRGGQSCSKNGNDVPCNANSETYFESAHCLRFSDLWYNVFKLLNPRLEYSMTVKIYARHKTCDKRTCWENLSKRLPGRVGTINEVVTDEDQMIMISYSSDDKVAFNLDCAIDYILVPQPLPKCTKDAELKTLSYGGPEEYLVLRENEITFDGEECDKAGVSYAAFAQQLHRCQQEAGSCLRNQPLHYWRKDKELAKEGKRGQYFLNNFIEVTDQAILQNSTSNQVVLRAPYFEKYKSQIIIEINADHIEIIGDKTEGQITEVYTDATSEKVTIVKAVVTNLGVASDFFGVDFANCSTRLGPSDFDKPGKDEIPPQHRITYTATISSPLKNRRVECKMVLYNMDQEMVASRHIIIVQGQRCMCVWHCQCVCYDHHNPALPCNPLSLSEYNRAGFPGHLPVTIGSGCSTFFTVLHALVWFFLFLILFGLIKAFLGLCFSTVALWGLWYVLPDEARSLTAYLEPQYAHCSLIRDCDGFPIHPFSCKRTEVHFLPWYSEFIVNIFFFICVFRSCLCDQGSHRGSSTGLFYEDPVHSGARGRNRCCSPKCFSRKRSPCISVCSGRRNRKFRFLAGAEEEYLSPDPQLLKDDEWANRLVDELIRSYVVFRVLTRPMGGVKSVPGTPYCVRGFFLKSDNGVYEFTPPSPLMQIWQMDGTPLEPPQRLNPRPFHALYHNASEVLGAHELSPWARGVVINAP